MQDNLETIKSNLVEEEEGNLNDPVHPNLIDKNEPPIVSNNKMVNSLPNYPKIQEVYPSAQDNVSIDMSHDYGGSDISTTPSMPDIVSRKDHCYSSSSDSDAPRAKSRSKYFKIGKLMMDCCCESYMGLICSLPQ